MPAPYPVRPVEAPVRGTIRPPGSKSLTNRAIIVAALADGVSTLHGVLHSDDTRVMLESWNRLGVTIDNVPDENRLVIHGTAGRLPARTAELWLENSGTSIRFLTAVCTLGDGEYHLDGNARMRQRPIRDLVAALRQLGADVGCELDTDCPPVHVRAHGLPGGRTRVAGTTSSQYLSALLMAAPCAQGPVEIALAGKQVSEPYVAMTVGLMQRFGVQVVRGEEGSYRIEPQTYRATDYPVEPDASAASYFWGAAAITGGRITVQGLSRNSLQGDVRFVTALEGMGCLVEWHDDAVTVEGRPLRGIDIDMNAISDTAQTLAAVACFADGPTRIRNVAHMRHKETDRVAAVVNELRRLGIRAAEHPDGLTIEPGPISPAVVETYDDHRMAMSFSLIGLRVPGVQIADPDCTAKTYPEFFVDLERLCGNDR